jgi:hypothetical protein
LIIESLWESLGFKKVIEDITRAKKLKIPYERVLLAMTANRLCEPDSKLVVWDRWLSKVYMPSCNGLKLKHMYDAMDLLQEAARYDGKWVIETNEDTISFEERCFRSLKRTQIKMMPMYHWVSRRIEAHVKICVMALMIERIAELEYKLPWAQIREALDELQVTEFFNLKYRVFMRNEVTSKTRNILNLLKINPPKQVLYLQPVP